MVNMIDHHHRGAATSCETFLFKLQIDSTIPSGLTDLNTQGLLNMVNDRCEGEFDAIDDVIPADARTEFMARYKTAAGFARDTLNAAPPTIAPNQKIRA